jgi:hypothetical protein
MIFRWRALRWAACRRALRLKVTALLMGSSSLDYANIRDRVLGGYIQ